MKIWEFHFKLRRDSWHRSLEIKYGTYEIHLRLLISLIRGDRNDAMGTVWWTVVVQSPLYIRRLREDYFPQDIFPVYYPPCSCVMDGPDYDDDY
jgi:hypothetical protein